MVLELPQMENEDKLRNSDSQGEGPTISDLLKAAFKHEGIDFESATLLRWQIVDDNVIPRPINTMEAFFKEFRDGRYQLTINRVKIHASGKAPIETDWLCAEIACSNGKWLEPAIFHDDGTYDVAEQETAQTIEAKFRTAATNLKTALDWVVTVIQIAEAIRRLFLGS
jgi:hypothetical protein